MQNFAYTGKPAKIALALAMLLFVAGEVAAQEKLVELVGIEVFNSDGELQARMVLRDDQMASLYFDSDRSKGIGIKPEVIASQSVRLVTYRMIKISDQDQRVDGLLTELPIVLPGHREDLKLNTPIGELRLKVTALREVRTTSESP